MIKCRKLTAHEVRALAVEAGCDPRTVVKWMRATGLGRVPRMTSTTVARIVRAVETLGYAKEKK